MKAFDESSFDGIWDNAEVRDSDGLGIGSIINLMMKVDKEETKRILQEVEKDTIREQGLKLLQKVDYTQPSPPIESFYIAKPDVIDPYSASIVLSKTLKNTLKLCKENWYMLTDSNLWKQQKEPSYYIIKEFHKYLDFTREFLNHKISQTEGEQKKNYITQLEEWLKLYTFITKPGYLSVLTKMIKPLVCDDDFENRLDNNPGKLAFKNGIVDLKTKILRQGIVADDFITKTIPYDYNPVDTTYIKSILKPILNNNEEHLEYYLSVIGFSFIGQPDLEKSIYFMIDKTQGGKGDNGKTFFFDILTDIFPNYVYGANSSLLDIKNTKVHKQLAMTKGIRLLWLEELPREKNTNAVLMKQLGDGKSIENEVMFGTSESINIMFKMFALSNHIPKIDPNEQAVYNRYKQISFNSKFDTTGTLIEDNPEKLLFKADTTLSNKIKTMHYNDVISLVVEYAHQYYISKLPKVPQQFLNDVIETKAKNDEFGMWFDENCEIVDGGKIAIKLIVKESGMTEKMVKEGMERKGFKYNKDLCKIGKDAFGKYYKGGYVGVKYIEPTEENDKKEDDTDCEESSEN
jgi:phage/plasmid-associated DNA primase